MIIVTDLTRLFTIAGVSTPTFESASVSELMHICDLAVLRLDLADSQAALRAAEDRVRELEADKERLCPPHRSIAGKLREYPQQYGCPQCAVNHIVELEELITEMWTHLSGLGKIRFNDTEAARIFERSNMEGVEEVVAAIDAARYRPEARPDTGEKT